MCLSLCHGTKGGNPNIGSDWGHPNVKLHQRLQTAAVVVTLCNLICNIMKKLTWCCVAFKHLNTQLFTTIREAVDWILIKVVGGQ